MGELVAKIIVSHCEARDIIAWKYGLRNEQAPANELVGLKSLDLSFNKLGAEAAKALSFALKHDRYLLSLNLRHNQFSNEDATSICASLSHNKTLFNLDLRSNIKIKQKVYRKIAVKLLENYTLVGKMTPSNVWTKDRLYFNNDLLVV